MPLAIMAPFGAASFVVMALSPIHLRGFSAALHAHGVVLSRSGAQRALAFEDVDEVWFEIERFQGQAGAQIHALRLVAFDGEVHRIPLAIEGAVALADGVLRACSAPLLAEARSALGQGETLRFGRVQLDRTGVTAGKKHLAWRGLRLAVVQRGKVFFYRRWPIVSSLTVHLDRIPNPTVFLGLVTACAPRVRVDDAIFVPFATAAEATRALAVGGGPELALRTMLVGGLSFFAGVAVTVVTYARHGDSYVIAYGAILFGAVRFFQGLAAYRSRPPR
jgi:hypothetical protein